MVGDKISNLIINLKNASMVGKESISVPYFKISESILSVLKEKNFIDSFEVAGREINITLKYDENENPAINDVKRVSKLSKRVYKKSKEINSVKHGYGLALISTPKGIVTDEFARENNLGGEVMFEIW
jgi:small subunit ribosomal protein S8